jgi:hypothetical protein
VVVVDGVVQLEEDDSLYDFDDDASDVNVGVIRRRIKARAI